MSSKLRVVMIVGDGFSRSLRNHLGLDKRIVTSLLFPAPVEVPFVFPPDVDLSQLDEDLTNIKILSDKRLFPVLWKVWDEFLANVKIPPDKRLDMLFFEHLSKSKKANWTLEEEALSIDGDSAPIELRSYLFYLFKYYHDIFKQELISQISNLVSWQWYYPLEFLNKFLNVSYISYNYDCVLEEVLFLLGFTCYFPVSRETSSAFIPPHQRMVLKPHGSITFETFSGFHAPLMWLLHTRIYNIAMEGTTTSVVYPPHEHPNFPDLVPPGHSLSDRINPSFKLDYGISTVLTKAELVILCGLSAAEPDTQEIEAHLSHISPNCKVVHVGRTSDKKNAAGKLLRKFSPDHYHFFDVQKRVGLRDFIVNAI